MSNFKCFLVLFLFVPVEATVGVFNRQWTTGFALLVHRMQEGAFSAHNSGSAWDLERDQAFVNDFRNYTTSQQLYIGSVVEETSL